jgi:hypothetical protein
MAFNAAGRRVALCVETPVGMKLAAPPGDPRSRQKRVVGMIEIGRRLTERRRSPIMVVAALDRTGIRVERSDARNFMNVYGAFGRSINDAIARPKPFWI